MVPAYLLEEAVIVLQINYRCRIKKILVNLQLEFEKLLIS